MPTRFRVEVLSAVGWHVRRGLDHLQAASAITAALTHPTTLRVLLDVDDAPVARNEFPEEPCTS